jgi:hypothetical protein
LWPFVPIVLYTVAKKVVVVFVRFHCAASMAKNRARSFIVVVVVFFFTAQYQLIGVGSCVDFANLRLSCVLCLAGASAN